MDYFATLAQQAEREICNPVVVGSIPTGGFFGEKTFTKWGWKMNDEWKIENRTSGFLYFPTDGIVAIDDISIIRDAVDGKSVTIVMKSGQTIQVSETLKTVWAMLSN